MDIDLGAGNTISTTHGGYDFVYYVVADPVSIGNIALDWVIVSLCTDMTCVTSYQVFYWGDNFLDSNTNIGAAGYGGGAGEIDNALIPMTNPPLFGAPTTGIAIDADPALVAGLPAGTYQYVRIYSPYFGGNDPPEVDAVVVLP